ncbi:MAG: hypothetical protein ACK6D3_14315 [Planctomycetaceae bacterium]
MLPIVPRTALLLCLAGSSWVLTHATGNLRADEAAPPAVIETIEAAVAPVVEVDPSLALDQLQPEAPALPVTVDAPALPTPATPAAEEAVLPTFVAPEAEVVGEVPVLAETLNAEPASIAAPAAPAEEIGYTPADQTLPDQPEPLIVDIPTPEELPVSEIGLPTPAATEPVIDALPEAPVVAIVEESIPAVETPADVVAEAIPAAPVLVEETLPEVAAAPAVETPVVETAPGETAAVEPVVEALPEAPAVAIVEESIPAVETPAEVVAEAVPATPVTVEETLPEVAAAPAVETPAVETPAVDSVVETVVETVPAPVAVETVTEPVVVVDTLPSTGEVVSEEPVMIAPVAEPVFTDISQETDFLPLPTFPIEAVDPTPDPRGEVSPTVVSEVVPVDTPAEIPATPAVEAPAETSVFEVLRSEDLDTTPVAEGAPQIDAPNEVIPPLPEISEIPAAESVLPEVLAEAPVGCQPPAEGVLADPEIAPSVDAPSVVVPAPEATDAQPGVATEIREVIPADECPSAPELPVDAGDDLTPVPVEVNLPLELFDSL